MLVILFKDILTEGQLRKRDLNERQVKAVLHVKENGSISNADYQKLTGVAKATATRDLKDLENKEILVNKGTRGSSSRYVLK